jgi:hypothetical protein
MISPSFYFLMFSRKNPSPLSLCSVFETEVEKGTQALGSLLACWIYGGNLFQIEG